MNGSDSSCATLCVIAFTLNSLVIHSLIIVIPALHVNNFLVKLMGKESLSIQISLLSFISIEILIEPDFYVNNDSHAHGNKKG